MHTHPRSRTIRHRFTVLPAPPGAWLLVAEDDLVFCEPVIALAVPAPDVRASTLREYLLYDASVVTLVRGGETGCWRDLGGLAHRYCQDLTAVAETIAAMLTRPSEAPDCDREALIDLAAEVAEKLSSRR